MALFSAGGASPVVSPGRGFSSEKPATLTGREYRVPLRVSCLLEKITLPFPFHWTLSHIGRR